MAEIVTKYMLAEEILRILHGGNVPANAKVRKEDIYASIGQVANTVLKSAYVAENLGMSELIPNGAMIALYESIPVVTSGQFAKAILPFKPIKLPRNMGVFRVQDSEVNFPEYIPVQMGQTGLLNSQPILNSLIGTSYENKGMEIKFNEDITLLGVTSVDIDLVVMDIGLYSEWDPLPIIADQAYAIKKEVLAMHGVQIGTPSDKLVNFNKEQRQPIQTQQETE